MSGNPAIESDADFSDELPPGTQLLSGQYTINSYLNHGGFGITYLATDSLSRQVVIKECFPGTLCRRSRLAVQPRSRAHVKDLQDVVRLFVKEAQSLSRVDHPNIVGVHQVFEDHGTAYMALDYVKGRDLLSYIEDGRKKLSPTQISQILLKLLDAVRFVHDAGLLHRDISPDNIILTEALEPILIDFGAAREQATKATQALSALRVVKDGYSPQEFYLAGSMQAPSSDLYSLAATFYHLIAGGAPPDSQLRITAHVAQEPDPYVPLGQRTHAFSESFCAAIDRAMAILPQDRLQSATEWKNLIKAAPVQISPAVEVAAAKPVEVAQAAPTRANDFSAAEVISQPVSIGKQDAVAKAVAAAEAAKPVSTKGKAQSMSTPMPKMHIKTQKKRGLSQRIPALLMGGAAAAVLVGGALLAPQSDAPAASQPLASEQAVLTATPERVLSPAAPEAPAAVAEATVAEAPEQVATPAPAPVVAEAPAAPTDAALMPGSVAPAMLSTTYAEGRILLDWQAVLPLALAEDATLASATDRLPAGVQLVAVNGQPVTDRASADATIARVAGLSDGTRADLALTWSNVETGAEMTMDLSAAIAYRTTFDNGLEFTTRHEENGWITEVVAAPAGTNMELQIGDIIVALVPDNTRIDGGASLAEVTASALAADRDALQFAVRRNGALWIADLDLSRVQG